VTIAGQGEAIMAATDLAPQRTGLQRLPFRPLFWLRDRPVQPRLRAAFQEQDKQAFALTTRATVLAVLATGLFMLAAIPFEAAAWSLIMILLLAVAAVAHYALEVSRRRRWWFRYVYSLLTAGFVTAAILVPSPFFEQADRIPQLSLRFEATVFFFIFIALSALTYSPRFVMWTGFACAISWGTGVLVIATLPDSITLLDLPNLSEATLAEKRTQLLDLKFVSISNTAQAMFAMMTVSTILAMAVWRTKRLMNRQMLAERERANLARYFSPALVDELSDVDEPLGAVRSQNVAVLFADIRGFTTMSEKQTPEQTIALLRAFHGRMADAVFRHQGTVDKYIGDAIMATFGTPIVSDSDAANALACAGDMLASIKDWNRERQSAGEDPINVSIAVHYGPAVLGDIGNERRLEYAVIGDTVNVASRLEYLTREKGVSAIVSQDLVDAAGDGSGDGLRPLGETRVRGREAPVGLFALPD